MGHSAKEIMGTQFLEIPINGGVLTGLGGEKSIRENLKGSHNHEMSIMVQYIIDKPGTAGTIDPALTATTVLGNGAITRQYVNTSEKIDDEKPVPLSKLGIKQLKREGRAPILNISNSAGQDVITVMLDEDKYNIKPDVKIGTQAMSFDATDTDKLLLVVQNLNASGIYSVAPSLIGNTSKLRIFFIPKNLISHNATFKDQARKMAAGQMSVAEVEPGFRQQMTEYVLPSAPDAAGLFTRKLGKRGYKFKDAHIEEITVFSPGLATLNNDWNTERTDFIRILGSDSGDDSEEMTELFKINGFIWRAKMLNAGMIVTDALYWAFTNDGDFGLPVSNPKTGKPFKNGLFFEGVNSNLTTYEFLITYNGLSEV